MFICLKFSQGYERSEKRSMSAEKRALRISPLLRSGPSIMRKRFFEYVPMMSDLYPARKMHEQQQRLLELVYDK